MRIDESGTDSLGSDHKRLTLYFGSTTRKNSEIGKATGTNLKDEQVKIIADMMENEVNKYPGKDWNYDEMSGFIKTKMDEVKQRSRWKGKRKPRSWWNKEIKEAIDLRKQASREHREAKRTGMEPDKVKKKMGQLPGEKTGSAEIGTSQGQAKKWPMDGKRTEEGQKRIQDVLEPCK